MSKRRASNKISTSVFQRKAHPSKVKMASQYKQYYKQR